MLTIVKIWIDLDRGELAPWGKVIHSYTHLAYIPDGSATLLNYGLSAMDAARKTMKDHKDRGKRILAAMRERGDIERAEQCDSDYNPEKQAYFFLLETDEKDKEGNSLYSCIKAVFPKSATAADKAEAMEQFNKQTKQK